MLALKCLEHMNCSLKYNICDIPKDRIRSCRTTSHSRENTGKISDALKYSCVYWASHLAEVQSSGADLIPTLRHFLHEHLLHWIECLSVLGELQTGLKSLGSANEALAVSGCSEYAEKSSLANNVLPGSISKQVMLNATTFNCSSMTPVDSCK